MIDWVTCVIPWRGARIFLNRIEENPRTGETKIVSTVPERMLGSYDDALTVETKQSELWISGNPTKFFSGQNVVGSNNLEELVHMMYDRVLKVFDVPSCRVAEHAILNGDIRLTRVDCTFHFSVGSDADVTTWLEAMALACHVKYRGRGHYDPQMASLLFGVTPQGEGKKMKGSRYSTFKFYNKLFDLNKKPPKCPEHVLDRVKKLCYGEVRAEALYRAPELMKMGYYKLSSWDEETAEMLNRRWIDKMEITNVVELTRDMVEELPKHLQLTYLNWMDGRDLRTLMTKTTFHRQRNQLLEHGYDIAIYRRPEERAKVVPVMRVLEAKPVCEVSREQLFWHLVEAA